MCREIGPLDDVVDGRLHRPRLKSRVLLHVNEGAEFGRLKEKGNSGQIIELHSIFLVRDAVIYLPRLVPYIFQNFT